MAYTPPNILGSIMESLLGKVEEGLEDYDLGTSRNFLVPGALPAWDKCCDGMLYVRVVNAFPSGNPFPQQDTRPNVCSPYLLASVLAVGVLRCVAVVNDQGKPPTAAQMTKESLAMTMDMSVILETLMRELGRDETDPERIQFLRNYVIGTWTPVGPDGGCAGGEWQITVGYGYCSPVG